MHRFGWMVGLVAFCACGGGGGDSGAIGALVESGPMSHLAWATKMGGPAGDGGVAVAARPDGGFVVTGTYTGAITIGSIPLPGRGDVDTYVASLSASGEILWARWIGGEEEDRPYDITVRSDGFAVVTGKFRDATTIGSFDLEAIGLSLFVACYSPEGNVVWARTEPGNGNKYGVACAAGSEGEVYVAGEFSGTATFGSGEPTQTTITASGGFDVFLARYSAAGTLSWARHFEGNSHLSVSDLCSHAGNLYVTGTFSGVASWVGTPNPLTSAGGTDGYVASCMANGALGWLQKVGGTGADAVRAIDAHANGDLSLVGVFFGTMTVGATALVSAGQGDLFLSRWNSQGLPLWTTRGGGAGSEQVTSVVALPNDEVLVAGYFNNVTQFDSVTLTSAGGADMVTALYSLSGALRWAMRSGGSGLDRPNRAAALGGQVLITGEFNATAQFCVGDPNETALTSEGKADAFVVRLQP